MPTLYSHRFFLLVGTGYWGAGISLQSIFRSADPIADRIVELGLLEAEHHGDGFTTEGIRVQRYNPSVPITEGAIDVHGIRPENVTDAPAFAEDAAQVQMIVEGEVLCGYNTRSFDALLLDAELERASQPGIDLSEVVESDPYRLWKAVELRSLEGAVRCTGERLDPGHARRRGDLTPVIHPAAARCAGWASSFSFASKNSSASDFENESTRSSPISTTSSGC